MRSALLCCLLFITLPVLAQDKAAEPTYRLSWQLRKGDELRFTIDSLIEQGVRKEAKLEGSLVLTELVDEKQAKAVLTLTKLYAIKELSGSGARVEGEKLADHKVRCTLFRSGQLLVNSADLLKLQKSFEDAFEDLDLPSHFAGLFFEFPDKAVKVGETWTKFQDNCTYQFKMTRVKEEKGSLKAELLGVPTNPNEGEEVQGSIKMTFDLSQGLLLDYSQRHVRVKSIGEVLKSEERTKIKRGLRLEKVKSILDETRTPELLPAPKKPESKPVTKPDVKPAEVPKPASQPAKKD